jgi:hypothetical protein
LLQRKFLPANRAYLLKLFLSIFLIVKMLLGVAQNFAPSWFWVVVLCALVEQKNRQKSGEVIDLAEKLNDSTQA